ncbi:MAG: sulfotransferase [Pseudomonadales bacterium]
MTSVSLNPDELMQAARERTQLNDFGDKHFSQGLEILLQTLDRHIADEGFRKRAGSRIRRNLETRLRITRALGDTPAIAEQDITRPVILTGLPRTGTSALFNLLANDPAARALLNWESQFPDPLPGHQPGQADPRRDMVSQAIEARRKDNADFDKMHYASADTPEECVNLHQFAFDGVQLGFEVMLEPYASWFQNHSLQALYDDYKTMLQMLLWCRPGERWLLKAPAHMWAIDEVISSFPDACVIWGHRSPLDVVPSISSMTAMVARMFGGNIEALSDKQLGPIVMEFYATSLERGLAARASGQRALPRLLV